jgi:hypothetical protein
MMVKYRCNLCGNEIKKLYANKAIQPGFLTCECSGVMEKLQPEFGTTSLETVDNGNMVRKVELRKDAVNRFKERGDIYLKNLDKRERPFKKDDK